MRDRTSTFLKNPMRRFVPLMLVVVLVPWFATLAAALIAAAGLADRGAASRAEIVGLDIARGVEKAVALGIPIDRIAGMDEYLGEALSVFSEVELVLVTDGGGRTLFQKARPGRSDLSVRLSATDTDWASLGLTVQRFPLRSGQTAAGEVVLGRNRATQPANPRRILVDFAVALTITLTLGALMLRQVLHSLVVAPFRLVSALDANLAERSYDSIAPAVDQPLIGGLLAEMNQVVIRVNDRFARVRSYLTEVRDLSFNKTAAEQVAPLLAHIERLGRFSPDRLTALTVPAGDALPHVAMFCTGMVLAVVAVAGARTLPLEMVVLCVGLGFAAAVPVIHMFGRRAVLATVPVLALWCVAAVLGGDPMLLAVAAGLGGLAAGLPLRIMRQASDAARSGQAASGAGGMVAGAGLAVLCAGGALATGMTVAVLIASAVGLLVALRVERGTRSSAQRLSLRQLFDLDRWWTTGVLRPRGWALWLATALVLLSAGLPKSAGGLEMRLAAELFWMHATPAWLGAVLVAGLALPAAAAGPLCALGTAVAGLAIAFGPVQPGSPALIVAVAALGAAHAASRDAGPPGAARGALVLAAVLGGVGLAGGVDSLSGFGAATLSAIGLVIAIAMLPPLATATWRLLAAQRGRASVQTEAP